jgi:hypothetical protein
MTGSDASLNAGLESVAKKNVRLFSVHGRLEKIVPARVPHSCLVHMLHMFIFFKMNLYDLSNDKKRAN